MVYTIIGLDGREYGPLTLAQVRDAVTHARINLDCLVKDSETGLWKRARDVAGISEPYPDPGAPEPAPAADRAEGAPRGATGVSLLSPADLANFVLSRAPSYNRISAQRIWLDLWKNHAGTTTTTVLVPNDHACIVIQKEGSSPVARGASFELNRRGWISIPTEFIAEAIKPTKPLTGASQESLDGLYRNLSATLFDQGEACGLVQFENGNAMRIDLKEDANHLGNLAFRTSFLSGGAYSACEYEPAVALPWPADISLQTVNHGEFKEDGWRIFSLVRAALT